MLSMPPDTTISAEPALMMSCASMVAFMPEPQTLLTVVAPLASGRLAPRAACRAAAGRALRGRGVSLPGRQPVAHEHFVDPVGRQFCPFDCGADHMGTELVRAE